MRPARGWIVAGVLAIGLAAAIYFLQPHADSPEHSSNSDAANGASAALLFAQAMGHQTSQMAGSFDTPSPFTVMFVFTPTSPYTAEEAGKLVQWVRDSGGLLIYASESGDPELDRALGVIRSGGPVSTGGPYTAPPTLSGVTTVSGGGESYYLDPSASQVPILRTRAGVVAGYEQRLGIGHVVALSDPLVLCNGYLEKTDNGVFLADLISASGDGASVTFDEYHHGLTVSDFAPQSWVATPWGAGVAYDTSRTFGNQCFQDAGSTRAMNTTTRAAGTSASATSPPRSTSTGRSRTPSRPPHAAPSSTASSPPSRSATRCRPS